MTQLGRELRSDKISSRHLHILRECPKSYVTQFSHDAIQLFMWSEQYNHALPAKGGILDQPALVMDALTIIRDETSKYEKWREHEEKTKREREREREKRMRKRSSARMSRS